MAERSHNNIHFMREICQIDHDACDTLHSIRLNWECGDEDAGIEDKTEHVFDLIYSFFRMKILCQSLTVF
jgi:hypothetical protein